METALADICEKIASINGKSKLEVYTSAFKVFSDCLLNGVPSNISLSALAVENIQSDLASHEEALKNAASHLFLALLQLSITLSSAVARRLDSWTYPVQNFLADTKSIVQFCFPLLGSKQQESQQESLSVVRSCIQDIRKWGKPSNEEAQTILTNLVEMRILPRLEEMLGAPEQQEVLAMEIWQQLIHSIGNYIPTTNHELINRLLKLIEFCFKSTRPEVQRHAYASWSILIRTFSLHPTFLVKKLRLFNVPLLSCAVKQDHRYVPVDVERAKTWCQLITSLASDLQDHSNSVLGPFFFFCIGLDPKLTQTDKFNETYISHFSSIFCNADLDGMQATEMDGISLVQRTLEYVENSGEFLSLLSRLASKQHLPKKAMADPVVLNEWREQLAFQGLQALAAFLNADIPQESAQHGLYDELIEQLDPVLTSSEYITARNSWMFANHRLLLVLIGICVQLLDPIHGEMIGECFRRILMIVTSSQEAVDRTQLLYPTLALSHTAVLNKHNISTVVKIISTINLFIPEQLCIPLSSSQREASIGARFFLDILLDPDLLSCEQPLPDAYFDLYQQLLYSRNIKTRNLTDYQRYLSKFGASCCDVTNTWRGWKLSAEAFLEVIQAINRVNEGTPSCPDFSSCHCVLSFPLTQCAEASTSSRLVSESADVWKSLCSHVLKLIAKLSQEESNKFIDGICQSVVALPKLQLKTPLHLLFTTQLLDTLTDLINFQHSVVFPERGSNTSPLSPPITPLIQPYDASESVRSLGTISQSILALSKLLLLSFVSEVPHSPSDAINTMESVSVEGLANSQAVTNVLMTAIQVFSHLESPLIIHDVLTHLSDPIGSYFTVAYSESGANSSREADTFYCLVARLWDVIKTCILTHFDSDSGLNTSFLQTLTPILLPLFGAWDQSVQTSACEFFSNTFCLSTDRIEYPTSLQPILTSLQERELVQLPPDATSTSPKSRKSQVRKVESRENPPTNSASKRVKLSGSDSSPVPSPSRVSNSEYRQPVLISSKDTTVDTSVEPILSTFFPPSEEDPLPVVESVVNLSKDTVFFMDTADTPSRSVIMTPDLTGDNDTTQLSNPPFKFYSERKQSNKHGKSQKEARQSAPPTYCDKEKRPFFKLQLTPLKLDDIKSSPTHHHSVNRKLEFMGEDRLSLTELVEAETLTLSQSEIPVLNPNPNAAPEAMNHSQAQVDSIEEFLEGIPLDAIISPDEINDFDFENNIPIHDIVSDDTNRLVSLTSTSVSQSITPPNAADDIHTETNEQADSRDLAVSEEAQCQSISSYLEEPISVNMCPMEVEPAGDDQEETVRNVLNDSIEEQRLHNPTLSAITTPEASSVTSTTHPFTTPTHSILKKQPVYSPSPNIKKVSFADPLEERHSIAISPRNRKLRSHKRGSKLSTNSASPLIRSVRVSSVEPIFPLLQDCREPVDILIPALTSQTVSRGIAGLLKTKNIETVGDLAMLSEGVAETLPIQPPKLETLRMAFTKYQATQLGNSKEITRQSTNPLVFPQDQVGVEEVDEGEKERQEEILIPTEIVELQDVESVSEVVTDTPVPVPLREDTISLETSATQTESIPLLSQLSDLSSSLDSELLGISQQDLIQLHNSLCQMLPTIVDKFKQI